VVSRFCVLHKLRVRHKYRATPRTKEIDVAKERSLALLRDGLNLGTNGRVTWSRDELHER